MPARGSQADGPLDRRTGHGWVRETTNHQYADAQRRGNLVTLLACESTGAISPSFHRALCTLGKLARLATSHDSTVYGIGRASTRSFTAHHLAAPRPGVISEVISEDLVSSLRLSHSISPS